MGQLGGFRPEKLKLFKFKNCYEAQRKWRQRRINVKGMTGMLRRRRQNYWDCLKKEKKTLISVKRDSDCE